MEIIVVVLIVGLVLAAILSGDSCTGDVEAKYRAEDDVPLAPEDNEYSASYNPKRD